MMRRGEFQQRHHDYVFGPNQDPRLATVAAGAEITGLVLQLDADAPFELRGRAVRQAGALSQTDLEFLSTRWTGPATDYRQQALMPERLQSIYFGQVGNPRPIYPPIRYPANGTIQIDILNSGGSDITNLTFVFRGVKLFPWDAVPGYSYPPQFSSLTFAYPLAILSLAPTEVRYNQIFQVKPDADFVLRAGLATAPFQIAVGEASRVLSELFFRLKDFNGKPYSNDFVPFDVMFGAGNWPSSYPLADGTRFLIPFGTGPVAPGLFYPEIYVPANHQLWYDVKRSDSPVAPNQNEDITVNLIGAKVFPR